MIGTLLASALQAISDARDALFTSARARVQQYMLENVRCPCCLGAGVVTVIGDGFSRTSTCGCCHGTGLRQGT
jgi:DnaJ-class molecular chaperone